MKKLTLLAASAFLLSAVVGCSSVQTAPSSKLSGVNFSERGQTLAHINVSYSGWYLLSLPLLTGSRTPGNGLVFADNTCNVTTAAEALTSHAKSLGATRTVNMVSTQDSAMFFPIPFIFRWKTVTVSGDAIR